MLTIDPAVGVPPTPTQEPVSSDRVHRGTRRLLSAFALLTALATHQLLVLGGETNHYWAWTIQSEPTGAFLGSAYAAGFVLSVLALRQRSWERIRVAVTTVTVFTVLTLVATIAHSHKLHFTAAHAEARAAAWFWLAVYLVVPAVGVTVVLRQGFIPRPATPARRPLPSWLRLLLAGQGAVLLGAGGVLFAAGLAVHHTVQPIAGFWPWPLTPLGAQVIGAWLVAFGMATALVLRDGDLARLRVPAVAYTVFGAFQLAVLATHSGQLDADASPWIYGAALVTIVGVGGYGWWAAGSARPVPGSAVPSPSRPA